MKPMQSLAIQYDGRMIRILDQTRLPREEVWVESPTPETMAPIIRELKVRGAPLIGVAAALQMGVLAEQGVDTGRFEKALMMLREARPTAVNLMNMLDRLLKVSRERGLAAVPGEAEAIFAEDVRLSESMAKNGASLIKDGERILTHCNTGSLATVGVGTALGAIIWAHREKKNVSVWVDETRPLNQGSRLTTWELNKNNIPHTLICDNMAAYLMQKGQVDRVMVGSDRIARNGDFANKIGTYSVAVACKYHGIPFHVVAPQTTVDPECASGADIPVEERAHGEIGAIYHHTKVWNPAFDVTPAELVTSWVLDRGVFTRKEDICGV
jgi:methylthioribose-1-phosphate isomerase